MKEWIKSLLYTSKHERLKEVNILQLIIPSIAGIVLCMFSLAGLTWAWFTTSIPSKSMTITAADYKISAAVAHINNGISEEVIINSDGTYNFIANEEYKITLTSSGNATKGYCMVKSSYGSEWYTVQIASGESISFNFIPQQDGTFEFISKWGTYSGKAEIKDGCIIGIKKNTMSFEATSDTSNEEVTSTDNKTNPSVSSKLEMTAENKDEVTGDKQTVSTSEKNSDAQASAEHKSE